MANSVMYPRLRVSRITPMSLTTSWQTVDFSAGSSRLSNTLALTGTCTLNYAAMLIQAQR